MTHERIAEKTFRPPQAVRHQFNTINIFYQVSKGILALQSGLNSGAENASQSLGRGNDLAVTGTSEQATPIDKFAYLSICQSQGMAAARTAFQKPKVIEKSLVAPLL